MKIKDLIKELETVNPDAEISFQLLPSCSEDSGDNIFLKYDANVICNWAQSKGGKQYCDFVFIIEKNDVIDLSETFKLTRSQND